MSSTAAAVAVINELPLKRLAPLLQRILERLSASAVEEFFDAAELQKLSALVGADAKALRVACDMLAYVF
eukprot:CAMPEP_0119280640 /NCGR_PEP_ID=MMETSP1329-20130426/23109_1 /TAXON_ID=114041 /ORGANISM="Genus nov. species nov., Strain RCC1024" /LENGTH=69 /DNA_ID=CAMNT_0007281235 /DNA_START=98 /DNA_END=304 /DNA_ORIENTATION=+